MREIALHRKADKSLDRIPEQRRDQIFMSIEEVARLDDVLEHVNVKKLSGNLSEQYRLRVGSYRVVFELRENGEIEILFINFIGTRGDAY